MGFQIPNFDLHEQLGDGGSGVVYRATDRRNSVDRAVKVLQPLPFEPSTEEHQRFAREVEAVLKLSHRAIVSCHHFGVTTGDEVYPYFVFDLVSGRLLRDVASEMNLEARVESVLHVLDALEYAHSQNVLHRDVKPSNLMVRASDGQTVLLDFGAAYILDGATSATLTNQAVGSLGYIPPEVQANPRLRTPQHDVFSTGVVLYELFAGCRPDRDNYTPLAEIDPKLAGLDVVVRQCLARAAERYASPEAMATARKSWTARSQQPLALAPSPLTSGLAAQLRKKKNAESERAAKDNRIAAALNQAWSEYDVVVRAAAESAFTTMRDLLTGAGEPWTLDQNEVEAGDCDNAILRLGRRGWQVDTNFRYDNLKRVAPQQRPVMDWTTKGHVTGSPPAAPAPRHLEGPAWVIATEGPGQSPSTVLRAVIAAGVVGAPDQPRVKLYARQLDGISSPFTVTTPEEVRDYFLTALARERGLSP